MPKLAVLSGADVCLIMVQHGFIDVRRRGSDIVMQMAIGGSTITVPVPNHRELRTGTLKAIIRRSGLPRAQFEV